MFDLKPRLLLMAVEALLAAKDSDLDSFDCFACIDCFRWSVTWQSFKSYLLMTELYLSSQSLLNND